MPRCLFSSRVESSTLLEGSRSAIGGTQEAHPSRCDFSSRKELAPSLPASPLPLHPYLQRVVVASGLEVFVLPHAHPEGSLEVHLEVHAGSTAEADSERGMAHLCEHLIFMGNRKRGDVVAMQGEANAFTDFHHTVYFVSWRGGGDTQDQAEGASNEATTSSEVSTNRKLNVALELMREVFTAPTQFTAERLQKEKAAVISESSLVNTIFYRKEQVQLSRLHSDTLLPARFPIGDMALLRRWTIDEVRSFFVRFYRPENASLYIVGDVAPSVALRSVDKILGDVRGDKGADEDWHAVREKWRETTVKQHSVFFPPLAHAWTRSEKALKTASLPIDCRASNGQPNTAKAKKPDADATSVKKSLACRLHVWQHSLLQHFSLMFLRKLPISALHTAADFFRLLARKLALQALAMRLTERCRSADEGWMRVEVADTESVKEGCRIVSVEAEAEQTRWRDAVRVAVEEVRQIAEHGLSMPELASLVDSYRINLDRMHLPLLSSADMLRLLMDNTACGHSVVHLQDERSLALQLAEGKFADYLEAATTPTKLGGATQKSERMKKLLDLINEETRNMFSWLDGRSMGEATGGGGPDAICAFSVQCGGARGGTVPGAKRASNTKLQGHVEEETGVAPDIDAATAPLVAAPDEAAEQEDEEAFSVSKEAILDEICNAVTRAVFVRQRGTKTPKQLLADEELAELQTQAERNEAASEGLQDAVQGAQTLQLKNGVKVTVKPLAEERGSALIRVLIPGGRLASALQRFKAGASSNKLTLDELRRKSAAMVVGARTMMEGGAMGPFTRKQIEAFCQERLIGVSIECLDEFLVIDIGTPAFAARDSKQEAGGNSSRTSTLETAMQLLHLIFTSFHFEESAFKRAKQQTLMDYHAYTRDLVAYSLGELIINMTGRDPRFDALKPAITEKLELSFVEQQMRSHIEQEIARGNIEVTVVGDVDSAHVARLALKYLGTFGLQGASSAKEKPVPAAPEASSNLQLQSPYFHLQEQPTRVLTHQADAENKQMASSHWTQVWGRRLHSYVRDSDTRAVVHIGGFACNRWGRNPDGSWVWQHMDDLQRQDEAFAEGIDVRERESREHDSSLPDTLHRKHPAFPRVALWILQELVTKRLFSILREEQRLTYEASFEVMSFDILWGGVFIVTVHTQPEEAERVLEATHLALQQLISIRPLLQPQLEGAKQQVIGRHMHDRKFARYWLDLLGGLQLPEVPLKTSSYFEDFVRVVESVTLQDVHLLLRSLGVRRENMWEAIGVSGPVPPPALSRPHNEILEAPAGGRSSTRLGAAAVAAGSQSWAGSRIK